MRAYSWIFLGTVAFACGGSAFSSNTNGEGADGGGSSESGSAGVLNRAGRSGIGGDVFGSGGKTQIGGNVGTGSTSAAGGMIGSGGDPSPDGGTTTGGASTGGGTTTGGASTGGGTTTGGASTGGGTTTGGTISTAGASSGGAVGTGGAPPDPGDKVCPLKQPSPNGACVDGLVCTYGNDIRTSCRPVATCSRGKWAVEQTACETLHGCQGIQVNKACDPGAKPCLLDATIYCVCGGCAGAGVCSTQAVWACAGSGGGACPKVAPNQGQACTGDAECNYGSCATNNSLRSVCDGATWAWEQTPCPL